MLTLIFVISTGLAGCGGGGSVDGLSSTNGDNGGGNENALLLSAASLNTQGAVAQSALPIGSRPVPKTSSKKMYIHIMPWFETKTTSGNGNWGLHWTMATQNPDVVDASGRRQIAAYYYPQTGPYASGDKDIIEYQLLLMKYSGADGVLIDWPGTQSLYDYPKNLQNAEMLIAQTAKIGLDFAIVYEDQNIQIGYNLGRITDKVAAAQQDMGYLKDRYIIQSNYIRVNGAPLLLVFGPQTFSTEAEWTNIFSSFMIKPNFLTLWYQGTRAGINGKGEYPWIYSDGMVGLDNFYKNRPLNLKFGVAYPGFNPFYSAGGWSGPGLTLPYGATFATTLDKALAAPNVNHIQIATWNDYGEGTMIEPTREFGYSFLKTLQTKFGVSATQSDLQLVYTLYQKRKQYMGNASVQTKLDQAVAYLAAYKVAQARAIIRKL